MLGCSCLIQYIKVCSCINLFYYVLFTLSIYVAVTSKSFTLGSMWTQYGKQRKSSILRAPNPSSSILAHSMKNKYDQNIKNILKYGALTSLKDDGALTSLILRAVILLAQSCQNIEHTLHMVQNNNENAKRIQSSCPEIVQTSFKMISLNYGECNKLKMSEMCEKPSSLNYF